MPEEVMDAVLDLQDVVDDFVALARAEDEAYTDLTARLVRHLDGHPDTPVAPCVMDGYGSLPNERELVQFSFIHRCPNCGAKWIDDYQPCECDGGTVALEREIAAAKESA